jgi:hypothetical protein
MVLTTIGVARGTFDRVPDPFGLPAGGRFVLGTAPIAFPELVPVLPLSLSLPPAEPRAGEFTPAEAGAVGVAPRCPGAPDVTPCAPVAGAFDGAPELVFVAPRVLGSCRDGG